MEAQVVTAWEIKAFDHIILDRRHYIVLSKNLVPVRSGSKVAGNARGKPSTGTSRSHESTERN